MPTWLLTNDEAICGDSDEVAHVSNTIVSGTALLLHLSHFFVVCNGSTGNSFISATIVFLQSLQNHAGIGIPKCLFLDMFQSHSSPLIHDSYLFFMCSGCQTIFSPCFFSFSFLSIIFMNHC